MRPEVPSVSISVEILTGRSAHGLYRLAVQGLQAQMRQRTHAEDPYILEYKYESHPEGFAPSGVGWHVGVPTPAISCMQALRLEGWSIDLVCPVFLLLKEDSFCLKMVRRHNWSRQDDWFNDASEFDPVRIAQDPMFDAGNPKSLIHVHGMRLLNGYIGVTSIAGLMQGQDTDHETKFPNRNNVFVVCANG